MNSKSLSEKLSSILGPRLVSVLVLCHGIFIVVFSLASQLSYRHIHIHISDLSLYISLGVGITLIYLSALLERRKRTALIATAVAYTFYLGANLEGLSDALDVAKRHNMTGLVILRSIGLPLAVLILLYINKDKFVVRSDNQGFRTASVVSLIIPVSYTHLTLPTIYSV